LLDDRWLGSNVLYLEPNKPPLELVRRLRRNEVLLIAADGMIASEFVSVPFLGGSLRVPCGWAFLAGLTGAPVVVLMDGLKTGKCREIRLRKVVRCASTQPENVYQAVCEATQVLEQHVRETPWAWHPWQRLQITDRGGSRQYELLSWTESLLTTFPIHPRQTFPVGQQQPDSASRLSPTH
jgi:lauroyl/myristoyl acyltransferase